MNTRMNSCTVVDLSAVEAAVRQVPDPELAGISIGSLGMVKSVVMHPDDSVQITLIPTFLGCPALSHIARDAAMAAVQAGATNVNVLFDHSTPWTTNLVDADAQQQLADLGIAVTRGSMTECPFCGSEALDQISQVGPASCRSAHWCTSCRNVVEVFRDSRPASISLPTPTKRTSYAHL